MGNFKVKTDKQTYNQVRSLLLESGFHISAPTGKDWVIGELGGVISSYSNWRDGPPEWFYDIEEITLPELRDMVVLKRNDVNDATHQDKDDAEFKYRLIDNHWHVITEGNPVWRKSSVTLEESPLFIKPIEKTISTLNTEQLPFIDDESYGINDQYAEIEQVWQDAVNHPSHYTQGKVECIDALESATIGKSGIEAVCVANVIKYLWRYEEKNGLEDVKKAQWYLERLVASMGS